MVGMCHDHVCYMGAPHSRGVAFCACYKKMAPIRGTLPGYLMARLYKQTAHHVVLIWPFGHNALAASLSPHGVLLRNEMTVYRCVKEWVSF